MKAKLMSAKALLKVAPNEIDGAKQITAVSKEAVRSIINWCGGKIPITVVINEATGNILQGLDFYRILQTLTEGELKGIKEIPVVIINQPDPQVERDLMTTLPVTTPNWRVNDFVELYAANGFGDYKKIQKLCDDKPRIFKNLHGQRRCMIAAMALKPGESSQTLQKKIKAGTFTTKIGEVRKAKVKADEVLDLATALDLQGDGDFTSNNIVSMLKEFQRVDGKNGHSNNARIAEFQIDAAQIKDLYRRGWNRSCWHGAFDFVETKLP